MHRIDKSAVSHPGFSQGIQVAALQDLLSDDEIEIVCRNLGHTWRDRIFTPAVTVRSMVHRALNPDKSIRSALADLVVANDRLKQTPADASWCEARSRLPQELWASRWSCPTRCLCVWPAPGNGGKSTLKCCRT
ncbi:MAG: transposase domain-containing protein [Planctomycetes bacterium]|nr:transposase domain-containing protein [Planctomycetota bacterium]